MSARSLRIIASRRPARRPVRVVGEAATLITAGVPWSIYEERCDHLVAETHSRRVVFVGPRVRAEEHFKRLHAESGWAGAFEALGEGPGHPFRGNQYTGGAGADDTGRLRAADGPVAAGVSPRLAAGAKAYQHNSIGLNMKLRGSTDPMDAADKQIVETMDHATTLHRFEGDFLYRGVPTDVAEKLFRPGADLYDDGFVSTSKSASYAKEFLEESGVDGHVVHIDIGDGARGLDMNRIFPGGSYDYQEEFVLPRGTGFHVKRVVGKSIYVGLLGREDEE